MVEFRMKLIQSICRSDALNERQLPPTQHPAAPKPAAVMPRPSSLPHIRMWINVLVVNIRSTFLHSVL
jgi:hypothetical protein